MGMFRLTTKSAVEPVKNDDSVKKSPLENWRPNLRKLRKGLFVKKEKEVPVDHVNPVNNDSKIWEDQVITNLFARNSYQALNDQRAIPRPRALRNRPDSGATSPINTPLRGPINPFENPSNSSRDPVKDSQELNDARVVNGLRPATSHKNLSIAPRSIETPLSSPPLILHSKIPSVPNIPTQITQPKSIRKIRSAIVSEEPEPDEFVRTLRKKLHRESLVQEGTISRPKSMAYVPKHAGSDFYKMSLPENRRNGVFIQNEEYSESTIEDDSKDFQDFLKYSHLQDLAEERGRRQSRVMSTVNASTPRAAKIMDEITANHRASTRERATSAPQRNPVVPNRRESVIEKVGQYIKPTMPVPALTGTRNRRQTFGDENDGDDSKYPIASLQRWSTTGEAHQNPALDERRLRRKSIAASRPRVRRYKSENEGIFF